MTQDREEVLKSIALNVRESIVRMTTDGGCFIGASLSCADVLVYLYSEFLNLNPQNLKDPMRDYLFLSKGHDVPALYGLFAELGFMEKKRLQNHLLAKDHIYWHPNRLVPGVEFHSGSLGHLPAVALGVALDCKIRKQPNKIVVVTGDGELNEGSVWETILVASAYKLDNLIILVDRNHFQANIATEELIPLEPLKDKFQAFGCSVINVDGHDFQNMEKAFSSINYNGSPTVVIANTIRGKGLPSIEARADKWFCNFSPEEVESLLGELHGEKTAVINSQTLTVR